VHPIRTCIGCEKSDDHPRHVIATADGSEVTWHMDCHEAATGCAVCADQVKGANGARGDELREHLVSLPPKEW